MQSWGPGILSFEAVNVNFGYFVQHIGPMKKHYWFFLIPPSGPASGSWRCWKMLSWGPGIQSFEAVIMNLGYLGQHTSSKKKTLWVLFNSTFRASFRPKKVLEIAVLRPWHPELWSCKHESRIFCSTYWLYEKHYWYFLIPTFKASFSLMEVLENAVLRPRHPKFWSCKHEFREFGQHTGPMKNIVGSFYTTLRASFRLMEMLENVVLRPCHPEFWSCYNEF